MIHNRVIGHCTDRMSYQVVLGIICFVTLFAAKSESPMKSANLTNVENNSNIARPPHSTFKLNQSYINLHKTVEALTSCLCGLSQAIGNFCFSRVRLTLNSRRSVTTFFTSPLYDVFSGAQNTRTTCIFRGGFSSVQFCT